MIIVLGPDDSRHRGRYSTRHSREQAQRKGRSASSPVEALRNQVSGAALPFPVSGHRFHPSSRKSFTMAWPALRVALEIAEPGDMLELMDRCNLATTTRWRVLLVTVDHVRSGEALTLLKKNLLSPEESS